MKRFRLVVRASVTALNALGAAGTGEDEVAAAVRRAGLEVEEVEGLDWWPDPAGYTEATAERG